MNDSKILGVREGSTVKVLISSDLALEALLNPSGTLGKSFGVLWQFISSQQFSGHMLDVGVEKIYSFLRMWKDEELAQKVCFQIDKMMIVHKIDRELIEKSYKYELRNIDSRLEIALAYEMKLDAIISLYPKDILKLDFCALSIDDFSDILKHNRLSEFTNKKENI